MIELEPMLGAILEIGETVDIEGIVATELEMPREVVAVRVSVNSVPLTGIPLLLKLLVRFREVLIAVDCIGNVELEVGIEVVAVSVTVKRVPIPERLELLKVAVKFDGTVKVVKGKEVIIVVDDNVMVAIVKDGTDGLEETVTAVEDGGIV